MAWKKLMAVVAGAFVVGCCYQVTWAQEEDPGVVSLPVNEVPQNPWPGVSPVPPEDPDGCFVTHNTQCSIAMGQFQQTLCAGRTCSVHTELEGNILIYRYRCNVPPNEDSYEKRARNDIELPNVEPTETGGWKAESKVVYCVAGYPCTCSVLNVGLPCGVGNTPFVQESPVTGWVIKLSQPCD